MFGLFRVGGGRGSASPGRARADLLFSMQLPASQTATACFDTQFLPPTFKTGRGRPSRLMSVLVASADLPRTWARSAASRTSLLPKSALSRARTASMDIEIIGLSWPPRRESNPHITLRRRAPYPLGHGETTRHFTRGQCHKLDAENATEMPQKTGGACRFSAESGFSKIAESLVVTGCSAIWRGYCLFIPSCLGGGRSIH